MNKKNSPCVRIGGKEFCWGRKTYVMGVVNMTTDSFSGDGLGHNVEAAVAQGLRMIEDGADFLDVGGESTRPASGAHTEQLLGNAGAAQGQVVSTEEEAKRVIPIIERLAASTNVPISVDTYKSEVARLALQAGASMLNDVWGVAVKTNVAAVAAEQGVPVVLVDNQQGTKYAKDPVAEIIERLRNAKNDALQKGVAPEHIILDPGFGFGKDAKTSLELLRRMRELTALEQPILAGTSRKSTIGAVLGLPPEDRVEGTAATVALAIAAGADIVRVHDVKEMARVARMADAVVRGWNPKEI